MSRLFLFLLTLPTLLVVFLVFGIPLAYSVNLSLHRVNMLTKQLVWVGFQNYAEILPNPDFLWALVNPLGLFAAGPVLDAFGTMPVLVGFAALQTLTMSAAALVALRERVRQPAEPAPAF